MRIRLSIPDHLVTPAALEAALEATTLANEQAIVRGEVPSLSDAISGGVRWKPEPFIDGEHFDLSHKVAQRGWGDCDDLAPWLAGELRATGEDTGAIPRVYKTGKDRWHVVVQTSDGEILDPSRWAGMGKRSAPSSRGIVGAIATPFAHTGAGALCVMPGRGKWWGRCDVPWPDGAGHLASHARASTPEDALDQAIAGAMVCGEHIESPLLSRVRDAGQVLLADVGDFVTEAHSRGVVVGGRRDWKKAAPGVVARYALRWRTDAQHRKHQPYVFTGASNRPVVLHERADVDRVSDADVERFWHDIGKDKRGTFRDHWEESGEGFFGRVADVLKSPVGKIAFALGAKALDSAVPGAGQAATAVEQTALKFDRVKGADSVLAHLASGHAKKVPGAQHAKKTGGSSLSLPHADGQPMTLYYHPAGSIGPVVMRF